MGRFIYLDTAYNCDPADLIDGVSVDRVAGVEAPLWTEEVATFDDVEHLCFPRLEYVAEVGWTAQHLRSWDGFRPRSALHAARLADTGVQLYRSPSLTDTLPLEVDTSRSKFSMSR